MTRAKRPNLFLIGAMKAGTGTLHAYLGSHPAIFMCQPKEPSYFVPRHLQRWAQGETRRLGEKAYLELFAKAADDVRFIGESSTAYSKFPKAGIAEAIARFSPDARLVYIMRDPVERTISQYWHHVAYLHESRDIMHALRENPRYCDVSHYTMQLAPYIRVFGLERMKILMFEELKNDPKKAVSDIFAWLGVDVAVPLPDAPLHKNKSPGVVVQSTGNGKILQKLEPFIPKPLQGLLPKKNSQLLERQKIVTEEVLGYLRPIQLKQTEELSGLLSRSFPQWTTLYGQGA